MHRKTFIFFYYFSKKPIFYLLSKLLQDVLSSKGQRCVVTSYLIGHNLNSSPCTSKQIRVGRSVPEES